MSKMKQDIWKSRGWERGEQIPGGNQGHTFLARKTSDPPGEFNFVLKKLKLQDKIDRRAMFCGEIRAMRVLDHRGVIPIEETNAEEYQEPVELYVVTPRIAGTDVETVVRARRLSFEDSVQVTIAVLGILDHCHARGVVHRDIKPCHVILRADSIRDPVLIDFGLAYHRDTQPHDAATKIGQGKGNRFLIGPEHLSRNPNANRNPVSDICQCLGLFYFAITGEYPGVLRDERNRKPHERTSLETILPDIQGWKRKALTDLFEVGFEWEPTSRWQSIEGVRSRLECILGDLPTAEEALRVSLRDIVSRTGRESHTARVQRAREFANKIVAGVQAVVSITADETKEYLELTCGPLGYRGSTVAELVMSMRNKVDRTKSGAIKFLVVLFEGQELNVSLVPHSGRFRFFQDDKPRTLGTFDLGDPECADDVKALFASGLHSCVEEILGLDT